MPIDYKNYPENWRWLSKQIIKDAGNRCELCYAPNKMVVVRDKNNTYPWLEKIDGTNIGIKIILTVHHIDFDKKNNKKQNLLCCCQRCHFRLDLAYHISNRKKKKIDNDLFIKENT